MCWYVLLVPNSIPTQSIYSVKNGSLVLNFKGQNLLFHHISSGEFIHSFTYSVSNISKNIADIRNTPVNMCILLEIAIY